jgi:tetratricopeptide (TPR) repeat protein
MSTEHLTATGRAVFLTALCLASAASACGGAARSTPRVAPAESTARQSESCGPGVAAFDRREFAAAAAAFDECIKAHPADAYTYYRAGLAYYEINRADLMVNRFESFVRLAPDAPERPEVESILRTARGRP